MGLARAAPDRDNVRRALGSFAAGVTIISTRDTHGQPVGMTATAFTSVSFSPPSVLTCLSLGARTHEYVRSEGRFGVNLLGVDGQGLSDHCASPGQDKVLPANWLDEQGGWESPCLNGAMAFFDCGVLEAIETGTHAIVIGSVLRVGFSPLRDSTSPLLHFRGSYRRLSPLTRGSVPDPLPIVFDDSPDHGGPLA